MSALPYLCPTFQNCISLPKEKLKNQKQGSTQIVRLAPIYYSNAKTLSVKSLHSKDKQPHPVFTEETTLNEAFVNVLITMTACVDDNGVPFSLFKE